MLNISIIQDFMRALQEHLVSGCNSEAAVGWFYPEQTSITRCLCNPREVEDYLERSIKESTCAGYKFILAPCFEDAHWSLLVICVSKNTIYHFDSVRETPPRKLLVKNLLNSVMKKLNCRSVVGPTWKYAKCAQQDNKLDFALYVMRFMLDIVNSCMEAQHLYEATAVTKAGRPYHCSSPGRPGSCSSQGRLPRHHCSSPARQLHSSLYMHVILVHFGDFVLQGSKRRLVNKQGNQ